MYGTCGVHNRALCLNDGFLKHVKNRKPDQKISGKKICTQKLQSCKFQTHFRIFHSYLHKSFESGEESKSAFGDPITDFSD